MFILYFMKSIDAPPPFDEPAWPARRFVRPWPVPSPEVGLVQPDTVHIDTQILDGDGRRWAENPQAISRSSGVFCWSHAAFQTKRVTRTANKLFRVLMKLRSTRECKINHELMQTKFLCLVCPDIPNTKDTVFKSLARNFAASFCSVLCSAAAVCHLRSMMQNTASHEPQHPVNGTEPACHAIKGSCSFLACPSATLAHLKLAASLGVSPDRLQHVANECLSWLPGFPSQTPSLRAPTALAHSALTWKDRWDTDVRSPWNGGGEQRSWQRVAMCQHKAPCTSGLPATQFMALGQKVLGIHSRIQTHSV